MVVARENTRMVSEATLFRAAAGSIMSPKEGGKQFKDLVAALLGN